MKNFYLLIFLIAFIACKKEPEKASCDSGAHGKGKFKMYEMSEISALMEQMYVDNQRLKERISKGDTIGKFPSHFLKIHKAVMSDDKENDTFFKEQAAH